MCVCQGGLLSVLGSLAMMVWLSVTPHNPETEKKRLAILSAFAFLTGHHHLHFTFNIYILCTLLWIGAFAKCLKCKM